MDGICGTIKNLVYCKVLSGDVVIDTPKTFATFANEISNVAPIPTTLKIHKLKWVNQENSFVNKFYYFSQNLVTLFTRKYVVKCGHKATNISDNSICNQGEFSLSQVKNGFNAPSVLSGIMKGAPMNKAQPFSSSYSIYSILIATQS